MTDLHAVWGVLMTQIERVYENKENVYLYDSRPYYMLAMPEHEQLAFKNCNKEATSYFLCGNESYLDTYGTEMYAEV